MNILVSACLLGIGCRYDGCEKENETVLRLREKYHMIPVCPEQLGGLPTPREPSERRGDRVISRNGMDMTESYSRGARAALKLAELFHCRIAVLKERSPSCGYGEIHDGTFSGALTKGDGMTAELLVRHGIRVIGESEIEQELL